MDFTNDIELCLKVLEDGGLILYPTDTVWGIGCDATNASAVKKIYELKDRTETKTMIVLVAEEKDILRYVTNPDMRVFEYLQQVQKPTTIIYDGAVGLAENLVSPDGSVALRIVQDNFCRHLVKRFRKPIVSTSANISGEPAPAFFREIVHFIKQGVDYMVQYRQEDDIPRETSTIIRWQNNLPVVVRP
ncbi:MAG: threonylcarbamoyl-AMP synthase [Chitinophagaceae bacterium]|nr:threonylcarbamoyl-AMP synthase [Chitinophagaceae bacterium]